MHIQTIRSIAKGLGLSTTKKTKADLIRSIQLAEGNFDCFGSANDGICDQLDCSWRVDCLPTAPKAAKTSAKTATKSPTGTSKPKAAPKASKSTAPKAKASKG